MGKKIVLLLGAGASVADVATKPKKTQPPLDANFFAVARTDHPTRVTRISRYMKQTYDLEIVGTADDSLEGVMGLIYPDLFNPALSSRALPAFRTLLQLFTARLAESTNAIEPTNRRLLYRMLTGYLRQGCKPSDITIITFNQDLQVEKTLEKLSRAKKWSSCKDEIFNFPACYGGTHWWKELTRPSVASQDELFPTAGRADDRMLVLKLHGSLNWYSTHNGQSPSPSAMFRSNRSLSITERRTIDPSMALSRPRRMVYTLPVIVPPVNHKSAVLHQAMQDMWQLAESRLASSEELVIFGYSCPALDFESSNLLRRANRKRPSGATTTVIDPAPQVCQRYIELLRPERLDYCASAKAFLS